MNPYKIFTVLDGIMPPPVFYATDQLTISKAVANIFPFVGVSLAAFLKFNVRIELRIKIGSLVLAVVFFVVYWSLRDFAGVWFFYSSKAAGHYPLHFLGMHLRG